MKFIFLLPASKIDASLLIWRMSPRRKPQASERPGGFPCLITSAGVTTLGSIKAEAAKARTINRIYTRIVFPSIEEA